MDAYYHPPDLARFGDIGKDAPELWKKFLGLVQRRVRRGRAHEREKALIALAVAHAVQCPYCIDAYTSGCAGEGRDPEQMTEAVHVAAAIRGGASLVHGVQMRNHVDRLVDVSDGRAGRSTASSLARPRPASRVAGTVRWRC